MSGHGVGGAILVDGIPVVATTLERLTRKKYDIMLPISQCDLETFGWKGDPQNYKQGLDLEFDFEHDYSNVDFSKNEKFNLLLEYLLSASGLDLQDIHRVYWTYRHEESAFNYVRDHIPSAFFSVPEHHEAHAKQAFYPSPFDEAAILVVDGQGVPMERTGGDQLSGCLAYGQGTQIKVLSELPVRYSLGDMYSHFTRLSGFRTNEECKTMGLSAYGTDKIYDELMKEVRFNCTERNWRRLDFRARHYLYSLGRYRQALNKWTEYDPKDMAYAGQKITEDVLIRLANWLYEKTKSKNLCISGGVALNCVANYKILDHTPFENVWIYPNAGDNGLAVGQALQGREYQADNDYLGREYSDKDIEQAFWNGWDGKLPFQWWDDVNKIPPIMAKHIADGKICAWYHGRSEYGPRALGNRSILADPRNPNMKDHLNAKVKHRESFRPFTPSVLREKCGEYFTLDIESPFMLLAPYVFRDERDIIPAVTHVDGTARVQTVTREQNPLYYSLIQEFEKLTGIPILLNTSFNVAGEPIVETPEDAVRCFKSTEIDVLSIGNYILTKE
jgi:carbamoyltransferase